LLGLGQVTPSCEELVLGVVTAAGLDFKFVISTYLMSSAVTLQSYDGATSQVNQPYFLDLRSDLALPNKVVLDIPECISSSECGFNPRKML